MKVHFVYPSYENVGIEYLSAVLKENGYKTKLSFDPQLFNDAVLDIPLLARLFDYKDKLVKEIKRSKPDIVSFSVISDQYSWACEIAKKVKEELDVPVVFGGIHPTSLPEQVIRNSFVDFVVRGEGEYAFLELVKGLEKGNVKRKIDNVWMKQGKKIIGNGVRPLINNLDELPFPD